MGSVVDIEDAAEAQYGHENFERHIARAGTCFYNRAPMCVPQKLVLFISAVLICSVLTFAQEPAPARSESAQFSELRKRAEAGDPKAQNDLGVAYRVGDGVLRNKQEAVRWYRKAALQAYPDGLFNLGISYYNGDGVATDEVLSYAWLQLAKSAGSAEAIPALEQISSEWRPSRITHAKIVLAEIYAEGKDYPKNDAAAFALYEEAAGEDDASAQFQTCRLELAFHWCKKASRVEPDAMLAVAEMYERGTGTKQDFKNAAIQYQALAHSNAQASYKLAQLYRGGPGLSKDEVLECAWLLIASERGVKSADPEFSALYSTLSQKEQKKVIESAGKLCAYCKSAGFQKH
jgi:TPR repeat protein